MRNGKTQGLELAPTASRLAGQVPSQVAAPGDAKLSGTTGQPDRKAPALLPGADGSKTSAIKSLDKPAGDAASLAAGQEAASHAGAASKAGAEEKENSQKPKFDLAKAPPIFQGWRKPKLVIVITGREDGYIEPCGCAGLELMKGGLSRRHTFLRQLREKEGWPVVAVDVGGNSKGFGRQAQLKFQATVDAMKIMGYDAIGLGTSELQLPADELLSYVGIAPQQPSPFVSANVGLFELDPSITPQKQVIQRGGFTIGVTSVLGKTYQRLINNANVVMTDPEKAVEKMLPELKKQCNMLILLAHATVAESTALSNRFPEFDIVVTAGGPAGEPPAGLNRVPGSRAILAEVGDKSMNAVVLGVFEDPNPQNVVRYQRVPLDARFEASPQMKKIMRDYQLHLQQLGFAGLGIHPIPHPSAETLGAFVGSAKCKNCHEKSYDIWKKTGHARAYPTLVNVDPPRHFDPECISCHVVGWAPQQFFPYKGGFESQEKTPHLTDVGCESCHGPGERHVKAEMGADQELQKKLQKAVRVTKEEAEKNLCLSCHDLDNSPAYQFKSYWPKVEHKETE